MIMAGTRCAYSSCIQASISRSHCMPVLILISSPLPTLSTHDNPTLVPFLSPILVTANSKSSSHVQCSLKFHLLLLWKLDTIAALREQFSVISRIGSRGHLRKLSWSKMDSISKLCHLKTTYSSCNTQHWSELTTVHARLVAN